MRRGGIGALMVLAACSTRPAVPDIALTSIAPDAVAQGQAVTATVRGSGFHLVIESDLDDGTDAADAIAVRLGSRALAGVVLRDETELSAQVPGDLAPGVYDVVVETSDGRSATLPAAFEVVRPCDVDGDCDDGDPCTTSEICVDMRCEAGPSDKDADADGFVDGACGGDDCDDDDELEQPGQTWYPDADGDGLGDASSPGNDCERAAPTDVLNRGDCDDSGAALPLGADCDDGDDCTELDTCVSGLCAGITTCPGECRNDCSGGCMPQGCCSETCAGSCDNSRCEPGCSCDLTCNASSCDTSCFAGTECLLHADDAATAALACEADSFCAIECSALQTTCALDCQAGASCLMMCGGGSGCTLTCAGGTVVDCGGGVFACRRDCP